ncbi:alpha/beta hydrolase [Streptomyces sp. H27-C3]|uniref:alpha/beta fold hydrolase n=1 Tax=Streptomyces sp. H27-C3 TaxID=3046305 RepID=UPI0024B974EA|nr:alpha/beta hydrolase [Streptomyces sp. H27-C3]MDJ0460158.1 alpha/beta hydrolase [Streptomyces sp. H27-C3]
MGIFGTHDGAELGYRLVGEGEPLICLLDGAPSASEQLRDLGGLGAHRELVLLDRRGVAESAAPAGPSTYRAPTVDDIEALREHLGLERTDVLAQASGADLALRYAAEHPGRLRSLVLVDPEPDAASGAGPTAPTGVKAPVLLLAGEGEGAGAQCERAAELAGVLPDAELVVLPGGGSLPRVGDRAGFLRTVLSFLDPDVLTVRANGLRMAYRTWGDQAAPPVVLLHGRSANSARWAHIARELAAIRRVYAIDLRGHGASDWPGSYGYAQMRDDVRAFLDALGLDRVDLVGHSMGGAVAALVAQAYPERVGRLVMEEPPPFPADPRRPDPVRTDEVLDYDWGVVVETDAQYNDPDPAWVDDLAKITAPALLIAGGAGSFMPQDRLARMAERIPGCRFVTIEAGHLIHQREPVAYLAELRTFGCY